MTTLSILAPTAGAPCKSGAAGQVAVTIQKPAWLVVYTVTVRVLDAAEHQVWEGQADVSGTTALATLAWPSPGNYVIEAKIYNGFGGEVASVTGPLVTTG